jgi:hypothetical protein
MIFYGFEFCKRRLEIILEGSHGLLMRFLTQYPIGRWVIEKTDGRLLYVLFFLLLACGLGVSAWHTVIFSISNLLIVTWMFSLSIILFSEYV